MDTVEHYLGKITDLMDLIGGWIVLPAISLLVFVDVILRYAFNAPLVWSLEFNEWALLLVFAFALPECTRTNGHIRMDLVYNNLSGRIKIGCIVAYYLSAIFVFGLLGGHEWDEFLFNLELDRATDFLGLPVWMHSIVLAGMSFLLVALFAARTLKAIFAFRHGDVGEVKE